VFGITAQTVRRVIPGRYAKNRAAIVALLKDAQSNGIRVLGYIAPLRNDLAPPYMMSDYRNFVSEMRRVLVDGGGEFTDLEGGVPNGYWGQKDGSGISQDLEVDFMHFQSEGHALLADVLAQKILPVGGQP
jgi:hypothetical protein